jgi:PAS domain-containing protein
MDKSLASIYKQQKMTLVSEIEKLKKQLYEQEIVYENILEGTLAGYFDWQISKDYEYLSPTFKSMFGYEDHEMANHPDSWQKIIFQEDLPKVFESFGAHVGS